jgi:hypothetical protein
MVHPMHNYKNYKQPMNSPFFHIFADETVVSVHNITTKNSVLIEQHIANCLSKAENSLNMCEAEGSMFLKSILCYTYYSYLRLKSQQEFFKNGPVRFSTSTRGTRKGAKSSKKDHSYLHGKIINTIRHESSIIF